MTECWLPAPHFEGFYEVSDHGSVRSVRHMTKAGWRGGRLLRQFPDRDGYWRVGLSANGKVSQVAVHRMVLEAFAGPCPEGHEARHGTGGKQDNRWPANLCWGTPLENSGDKYRDKTMACGERQGNARFTEAMILDMRARYAAGETQEAIAAIYGTRQPVISRIIRRESWRHLSLTFTAASLRPSSAAYSVPTVIRT